MHVSSMMLASTSGGNDEKRVFRARAFSWSRSSATQIAVDFNGMCQMRGAGAHVTLCKLTLRLAESTMDIVFGFMSLTISKSIGGLR